MKPEETNTTYTDKSVFPYRRYTLRKDGTEKVEIFTYGTTGKTMHGTPANGHYKLRGYRKGDTFSRTMKGLKEKLSKLQTPDNSKEHKQR